jgi:hypothetical protein
MKSILVFPQTLNYKIPKKKNLRIWAFFERSEKIRSELSAEYLIDD